MPAICQAGRLIMTIMEVATKPGMLARVRKTDRIMAVASVLLAILFFWSGAFLCALTRPIPSEQSRLAWQMLNSLGNFTARRATQSSWESPSILVPLGLATVQLIGAALLFTGRRTGFYLILLVGAASALTGCGWGEFQISHLEVLRNGIASACEISIAVYALLRLCSVVGPRRK